MYGESKKVEGYTPNQKKTSLSRPKQDNDETLERYKKKDSRYNRLLSNYTSQGKLQGLKDSNNGKSNYQSLSGLPKLKNPKKGSYKPYDPVGSSSRIPDTQLKEMQHFNVIIGEIREFLSSKQEQNPLSIPEYIRENEVVREKIKSQNMRLNRLIEKKTLESMPVNRNSYRFFNQRNNDDLSKVYQSHLDAADKNSKYLKLQEEILDKQLNKVNDKEFSQKLDEQLESYRNFDRVIQRDIFNLNRDSEEMTKMLITPKILYEKKATYEYAITKIHDMGKRNKSLERKLNKVMEDIGQAQIDEEQLQFDKKDLVEKYDTDIKYDELKKYYDYSKAQKEVIDKDLEKYQSRVARNNKLIENEKSMTDKESSQRVRDVEDIERAYNVLREEVATEFEKLKNTRTDQIAKGFVIGMPNLVLENEKDDKKANDMFMVELNELGNRLHNLEQPKDEVSKVDQEKSKLSENRHRSNSRGSHERSQEINVNTWRDDIKNFKKTKHERSSPKYEKYLKLRERDYNEGLHSRPKRSVFDNVGSLDDSSYFHSQDYDGLLQQKPVNPVDHQKFLTESLDQAKQNESLASYNESIPEDILEDQSLNKVQKKGQSDKPLV